MYWHRLESLPSELLTCALQEYKNDPQCSSWYSNILLFARLLNLDLSYCKKLSHGSFKSQLLKCLKINFLDSWQEIKRGYLTNKEGKLDTYFTFKNNFTPEPYLVIKMEKRKTLAKFRTSNHILRIETGRHERVLENGKFKVLPRDERICKYCNNISIESEVHFLLECNAYEHKRKPFIEKLLKQHVNLKKLNNSQLFSWFMINEDLEFINDLCNLIEDLYYIRQNTINN